MHVELTQQHSEKVMSDSSGPVVFAIDPVDSVLYNLPDGESEVFWGNSNYRRFVTNLVKNYFWLVVKMCLGLVHASYILSPLLSEEDTVLLYCDASIAKV